MFQIKKIALQFQNVFFMVQLSLSFCSILNYTEADGDLNMLPLLKRIIQNKIPLWIFRLVFFTLYKIIYYIYIYIQQRKKAKKQFLLLAFQLQWGSRFSSAIIGFKNPCPWTCSWFALPNYCPIWSLVSQGAGISWTSSNFFLSFDFCSSRNLRLFCV